MSRFRIGVASARRGVGARLNSEGEIRRAPRLADAFDLRANSLNAPRLLLAAAVLVSHSWKFGYGELDPLRRLTKSC